MRNSRYQILTILNESGLHLTPSNISYNINLSQSYVQRECQYLWNKELLDRDAEESRPFYSIRERGQLALEYDTLDIEYSYHGHHPDGEWDIIVQPAGKSLSEFGADYHDTHQLSWGKHGGDGGAFNVAQDLLRHAVDAEAAETHVFQFYQEVTSKLNTEFELSELEIRAWVANREAHSADHDEDTQIPADRSSDSLPVHLSSMEDELTGELPQP